MENRPTATETILTARTNTVQCWVRGHTWHEPLRWDVIGTRAMIMDCSTCTAMPGSGVKNATMRAMTPLGLLVFCVGARGTTTHGAVCVRTATTTRPTTVTSAQGFECVAVSFLQSSSHSGTLRLCPLAIPLLRFCDLCFLHRGGLPLRAS